VLQIFEYEVLNFGMPKMVLGHFTEKSLLRAILIQFSTDCNLTDRSPKDHLTEKNFNKELFDLKVK
jgi:hypothetical protein